MDFRGAFNAFDFLGNGLVHKMSTTIDTLGAVQKSASLHKEEMLKMKEIATMQQQEKEHREKVERGKKKLFEQEQELMLKYKRFQSEQKIAEMSVY